MHPLLRALGLWLLTTLVLQGGAHAQSEGLPGAATSAASATTAASAPAPVKSKRVVKDMILRGDARCTRCHNDVNGDEVDTYPISPMGRTKHGTRADGRTPTCVSCHGDSERHLQQTGRVRPLPDRPFGKKAAANPKAHNDACLACHQGGDKLMHWSAGVHARSDLLCTSCHQLHVDHDPTQAKAKVAELCQSCHKEKRGEFARPNHHPVPEGKMSCVDCHNPHGSAGPKMMVRDSVNETCYSCHAQYRGPYLWNHQPVTQDCALCHNPHGSTTAGLLKHRAPFLCQQCHEPTSHRGNIPGLNGQAANSTGASGLTQARGCVNCHNEIHGGNNPTSAGTQRTFRR